MLDTSSLPLDREGRAAWLAARQDEIAAAVRAALRSTVERAVKRFMDSLPDALVASGDLGAFDEIPKAWLVVVDGELLPKIGETFQAGQVTAWLGTNYQPTPGHAVKWQAVANQNAVSYMADASNRLSQVGDDTWKMIRKKAQNAVAKGTTNEALKKEIESITGFSEFRADTIARTETVGAYVQGDMAGARALGVNGPVEKVWVAAIDARTRETHAAAHNQCVPMDQPFDVGGVKLDSPHDPSAPPGEVVNCRCYVEMLYPGDTRPDGSIVEPPEGWEEPAAEPEVEYDAATLDRASLTPDPNRPNYYRDQNGTTWRHAPMTPGEARAAAAQADLSQRLGINSPRVRVTDDGAFVENFDVARPGFPGTTADFDASKIGAGDLDMIQRNRVLDYVLGNQSTLQHTIRQGYASSGTPLTMIRPKMSPHFTKLFPGDTSIGQMVERAWANGRTLVSNGRTARDAAIKAMGEISDGELRAMFRGNAVDLFPGNPAAQSKWLDDMVARKNRLVDDFAKYDGELDKARAKALKAMEPPKPKQVPLDGTNGGPKGMSGALDSQIDTRWMRDHDSPITVRGNAPNAYQYTAGSSPYNGPARNGQVTAEMQALDRELGAIKSDMVLHRGVTLSSRQPPGGMPALQGNVIIDEGYVSTSAGGKADFSGDTYYTIRANAGTPGSWVKPISAFSRTESELLLGRNVPMYVHSVVQTDGGKWLVQLETVSPEWVQATGLKTWSFSTKSWS